jgi:glycosyltransferase involved in cell wall biosynthesis
VRALELDNCCDFVGHYTSSEGRSAFFQSLDLFVLPSFAEGTPNSVIEAMAAGLPVIATRIGGLPDLVTDQTGILVDPGNGDALARAMQRLAADRALRERMGRAARRRYESLFSSEAVMPLLLRTYRQLVREQETPSPERHPWEIEIETLAAQ